MKKNIFITGSSGCVGHYVIDQFIDKPNYHLHLLARDPSRFKFDVTKYDNVTVHIGDMERIEELEDVIRSANYLIHIFTDWSDGDYASFLNVEKTHTMFSYCTGDHCEKIIYFSTASILGRDNQPVYEALTHGTGYVKSKYLGFKKLKDSPVAHKVITVFPTLVFGGDATHPYSHINSGVMPNLHYMKYLKYLYVDGGFHFIHSKDIAAIVHFLIERDTQQRHLVLGNPYVTCKQAIAAICRVFSIPQWLRLQVSTKAILFFAKVFKIQIAPWDLYCIQNPHMRYQVVSPQSFGLETAFPTLDALLLDIKANHEKAQRDVAAS